MPPLDPKHPLPSLQVYPSSGLSFPWAEYNPHTEGTFDASFGCDGVGLAMTMLIYWKDLEVACQQLLGYSYRPGSGVIRRKLPWQHPYFTQLWVKNISKVMGIRPQGKGFEVGIVGGGPIPGKAAAGPPGDAPANVGPWTDYYLALLTIHFWRPPYSVRSDKSILINGVQQEYLRYLDKRWEVNAQILSREGSTFVFVDGQGPPSGRPFQGSVGQQVSHLKLKRRWYEIPEAAIFSSTAQEMGATNGPPTNLIYTQTQTTNPITDYVYPAGSSILFCVNAVKGGGVGLLISTFTNGSPVVTTTSTAGLTPGMSITGGAGVVPPGAKILTVDTPTQFTMTVNATGNATVIVNAEDPAGQFFGFPTGTLLLEGVEIIPRPLQLPPALMNIPIFAANEPISQQQYDVVFHFDYFDPPGPPGFDQYRGHNRMPYSGDGLWYVVQTQNVVTGTATQTTPFQYADFTDLFKTL